MSRFNAHEDTRQRIALQRQAQASPASVASQQSAGIPAPVKFTVTFDQLVTGATTGTLELMELPAGWQVHWVKIKHRRRFRGGAISAYTLEVGTEADPNKYATAFDVYQEVDDDAAGYFSLFGGENDEDGTPILVTATSTGANLDAAQAGAVDIWLWISEAT